MMQFKDVRLFDFFIYEGTGYQKKSTRTAYRLASFNRWVWFRFDTKIDTSEPNLNILGYTNMTLTK
jgi:hypothetical protein